MSYKLKSIFCTNFAEIVPPGTVRQEGQFLQISCNHEIFSSFLIKNGLYLSTYIVTNRSYFEKYENFFFRVKLPLYGSQCSDQSQMQDMKILHSMVERDKIFISPKISISP